MMIKTCYLRKKLQISQNPVKIVFKLFIFSVTNDFNKSNIITLNDVSKISNKSENDILELMDKKDYYNKNSTNKIINNKIEYIINDLDIENPNNTISKSCPEEKRLFEHRDVRKDLNCFKNKEEVLKQSIIYSNKISTSKYNWFNCIPKILIEQFRKLANFYFLMIAILQVRIMFIINK